MWTWIFDYSKLIHRYLQYEVLVVKIDVYLQYDFSLVKFNFGYEREKINGSQW